ncbi:related to Mitochondrial acidic protein MAM33 [Zygosaccharomyces bailii ISA1307]|nr:related to Mitochondrial acidic protein MAM33 [Zygosaccharomyces bailii ISA1307]
MSFRAALRLSRNIPRVTRVSGCRVATIQPFARILIPQTRTFMSTPIKFDERSKNVGEILKSEISVETESEVDDQSKSFQEFLDKYDFSVIETPGKNLAEIVRKTADGETVHVFFDVAQVANLPYDAAMGEASKETEDEQYNAYGENFANVNVVVAKEADQSTISIELLMNLSEGAFYVDSVTPFANADAALNESAEAEVKRELLYHGPPFSNLDEELQESLEAYLESRGVTEELAAFIESFSEFKENQEYIKWLKGMKSFFS